MIEDGVGRRCRANSAYHGDQAMRAPDGRGAIQIGNMVSHALDHFVELAIVLELGCGKPMSCGEAGRRRIMSVCRENDIAGFRSATKVRRASRVGYPSSPVKQRASSTTIACALSLTRIQVSSSRIGVSLSPRAVVPPRIVAIQKEQSGRVQVLHHLREHGSTVSLTHLDVLQS